MRSAEFGVIWYLAMFGLLNINKPAGITSRTVVNQVQRLVHPVRVGHAGTLDPLATGVLVVCLGPATKLVPYIHRQTKHYLATFLLGRRSDSDDIEMEVETLVDAPIPSPAELQAGLAHFRGEIEQRPPRYSAVKVNGHRAYKLARAGKDVKVAARTVVVHELRVENFDYPQLALTIRCGSGTYVRSLGRDLAESLGTGAVMSALQRIAVGSFDVARSISLEHLSAETVQSELLPPSLAVVGLPKLTVTAEEHRRLGHGLDICREDLPDLPELAAIDEDGNLVAILAPRRQGLLRPLRNFPVRDVRDRRD
jgi:tRNA pseudouridine55 synthase